MKIKSQKAITALKKHMETINKTDDKDSGKRSLFEDCKSVDYEQARVCLDILSFKIPTAKPLNKIRPLHPVINRFQVPNSLTDGTSAVLLITRDYPKLGADVKLSNAHYRNMLTNADCNQFISEIMTLSELKGELSELDSRKNLCKRIDYVLCDSNTVKVVPRILGRPFQIAKKFPHSVNLASKKLKEEILKALSQCCHKMTFRNTQSSLTFGNSNQSVKELTENLDASIAYLKKKFPGGWDNVKTLYLSCGLKARVPLYVSQGKSENVTNYKISMPKDEILSGDFGFGEVKISSSGKILDYKPDSDDEDYVKAVLKRKERKRKLEKQKETEYLKPEEKVQKIEKILKGQTVFTVKSKVKSKKAPEGKVKKNVATKKGKKQPKKQKKELLFTTEVEELF